YGESGRPAADECWGFVRRKRSANLSGSIEPTFCGHRHAFDGLLLTISTSHLSRAISAVSRASPLLPVMLRLGMRSRSAPSNRGSRRVTSAIFNSSSKLREPLALQSVPHDTTTPP